MFTRRIVMVSLAAGVVMTALLFALDALVHDHTTFLFRAGRFVLLFFVVVVAANLSLPRDRSQDS